MRKAARGIASAALVLAVAATLAGSQKARGHAGEDYVNDPLDVIPGGTVGLLPDEETDPALHGQVGPLICMHAMSVHNTLLWKYNKPEPTMLMFHRHSAYRADEVANPNVIRFLIDNPSPTTGKNAIADPANQLNTAFRRSFVQFCYGGYNIIHDVSQSVPTRIRIDQDLELTQLWDMNDPRAFKYDTKNPKYSSALLNQDDAELNIFAFRDMGFSKGLAYDMYCPGFSTLADGRAVFMGGHDMNSQNGSYRTQVFDPDTEKWAPRPISCMRAQYGADPNDPYLEKKYQAEIDRLAAEGLPASEINKFYLAVGNSIIGDCNPHLVDPDSYSPTYPEIRLLGEKGTVTHPKVDDNGNPIPVPSDMKYARWYPTSIALPNNSIYIYAGWDRDEKFDPEVPTSVTASTTALKPYLDDPENPAYKTALADGVNNKGFKVAGNLRSSGDAAFLGSTYRQPVSEVYDAATDTTSALENARLLHFDWYPNGTVVQTGPGRNDWKVAVLDGEIYENVPGGYKPAGSNDTFPADKGGVQSRFFNKTWLIDVQGAMKDPRRNDPTASAKVSDTQAGKFVTYLDKSFSNHTPFSGNANIIELDKLGKVVSHKLTQFGGAVVDRVTGQSNLSKTAEQIDFANLSKRPSKKEPVIASPKWKVLSGELYQPGRQNYATPTPDGNIIILGGNGGTLPGIEAWSLHLQHCNPETGEIKKLAKSLVPRDEHGIIQLMPDATVYLGGQNRNGLIRIGDSAAPAGDSDLGVPSAQLFRPPYLFDARGNPADRPMIYKAPTIVDYGKPFKVGVYSTKGIKAVSLIRTGSMSHALNTDLRLVKVPFKKNGSTEITVFPPKLPGTAVPGNYMLFVVDENGVPSKASRFSLGRDVEKRVKALKKAGLLTAN